MSGHCALAASDCCALQWTLAVPVEVPVPRGAYCFIAGAADMKRWRSGQLQATPLMAKEAGTAFVVPFQVPLNPIPDNVAPAAIVLL